MALTTIMIHDQAQMVSTLHGISCSLYMHEPAAAGACQTCQCVTREGTHVGPGLPGTQGAVSGTVLGYSAEQQHSQGIVGGTEGELSPRGHYQTIRIASVTSRQRSLMRPME